MAKKIDKVGVRSWRSLLAALVSLGLLGLPVGCTVVEHGDTMDNAPVTDGPVIVAWTLVDGTCDSYNVTTIYIDVIIDPAVTARRQEYNAECSDGSISLKLTRTLPVAIFVRGWVSTGPDGREYVGFEWYDSYEGLVTTRTVYLALDNTYYRSQNN